MKRVMIAVVSFLLLALPCASRAEGEGGVSLTVYNNDLALVKDVRAMGLERGVHEVRFDDVAARIDPTSVHFKIIEGEDASVWEQNYRFDLASSSKILEKYLEKDVEVITEDADLFAGRLVSFDGSTVVLEQGRGDGPVVTINREKVSHLRFPALPSGLISKPTLVWKIGAEDAGERLVEVTYLTSNIDWHAEYVGVVSDDDSALDLAAWVSIDNRSGASYEDAKLDLVAGDIHRALPSKAMMRDLAGEGTMPAVAPEFVEEAFFEYYLYKLDTRSSVADREIKQLTFFPSTEVSVEKVLEYEPYMGSDVRVLLVFENSVEAGIGRALPAGKVRLYKADSGGDLQFIGEDRIDHTPKDEEVRLYTGNAFDVKVERKRMAARRITDRVHEEDYEVSIRNHKDVDVVVRVVEHPRGFWTVMNTTYEFEKKEANRIEFPVSVAADGEAILRYTIRYES